VEAPVVGRARADRAGLAAVGAEALEVVVGVGVPDPGGVERLLAGVVRVPRHLLELGGAADRAGLAGAGGIFPLGLSRQAERPPLALAQQLAEERGRVPRNGLDRQVVARELARVLTGHDRLVLRLRDLGRLDVERLGQPHLVLELVLVAMFLVRRAAHEKLAGLEADQRHLEVGDGV
jgi:hypothetical protein